MIIHAVIFIIFLNSSVFFALPQTSSSLTLNNSALFMYFVCSSITQVMTCYIFWNMDNIHFVPVPAAHENDEEEVATEEVIEEVRVERIDSEFDL